MPPKHPATHPDASTGAAGATTAILVVDDERSVRAVVVRLLQRRGYEAVEAPDAETALSILSSQPGRFRLVITDDRMPGMSGYELAAVIARIHPRLRIVLMSGYSDTPDALGGQGEILRVLPKPFTVSGLLDMVTDILSEDQ
jgi:two-component system cell cycle sensor histidine kinase/response regulator CckA